MKLNTILRTVAMAAALVSAVPLLAKPFTKTISIAQSAKIGKVAVQAGDYRLMIDGNKATIEKGKEVVAESEGRWENRDTKSRSDSVLIDNSGQVKEVRFAGQNRVFVFNG